ncbi:uncharacterized protein LOC124493204 [Dermatophagoides farinae]|uniref:CUB domain-containing protein n=1 Tax=Dermatophagoides farinae TaxID=6954 RepID=A0A922IBS9_DERFA|nr:uncharacterized protein LOC124493204 [Dermatophagoides farinae]XP_046912240.1 uncharacterized protein LOC124493204 [Dermatophagoides farinae]KAH7641544.1 hypothetical protein HUG17_4589 [Dermatophagoides farinae]KAH9527391.1 hypothetical protein DERF_001409 [Dermatophagoides farinae]
MQVSSWIMILKAYNWLLLILACQCRPNLILANRFASHRTRLLDTEQIYKDRPKPVYNPNGNGFDVNRRSFQESSDIHPYQHNVGKLFPDNSNVHLSSAPSSSSSSSSSVSDNREHHHQQKFFTILNNNKNEIEDDDDYMDEIGHGCMAPDQRQGTCYEASICAERGGIPMGRCGGSKNGHVCCLFEVTCSQTIRERHVYFRNPNFPYSYDGQRICRAKIQKLDSSNTVCQLKLTFDQFDIAKPIEGNCTQDSFLISGQNENNIVPRICGHNNGQHYYIGVDESGMVTLHMVFRGDYPRKFDIHIEQIDCGSRKSAPAHCLQYYEGTQGTIKSFNYDSDELANRNDLSNVLNEGYPNNVDYMICIRKETGFCSISYEFMSDPSGAVFPFSVGLSSNQFSKRIGLHQTDDYGRWTTGKMYSTVQTTQCDDDYLIVSGTKVCTKIVDSLDDQSNNSAKENIEPTEPSSSLSSLEDLITPGNISENRPNRKNGHDNRNGDLLEHLGSDLSGEVEELRRHHRQVELFKDVLTRRYRWMMSSPMILRKDSLKRLHQNYLMTTDSTPGPFQLRFVSNSVNNAKGFYLAYRQNPCKM